MREYEDALLHQESSNPRQRVLIHEDSDDAYFGSGKLLPPPAYQGSSKARPLIQEQEVKAPQSSSALTASGKANLAAYLYHQNKVRGIRKSQSWKRGMPYSPSIMKTFGAENPRQAANLDAQDVPPAPEGFWGKVGAFLSDLGLKSLFGQATSEERAAKRQEWKDKRQGMIAANGGKRTWMQRLFGAYKKKSNTSARAMGITSTKAPKGVSSGWADQLIDASKDGRLLDGADPFVTGQLPDAGKSDRQHSRASAKDDDAAYGGGNGGDSIDLDENQKKKSIDFFGQFIADKAFKNKRVDDDDDSEDEQEDDSPERAYNHFLFKQAYAMEKAAYAKRTDEDD